MLNPVTHSSPLEAADQPPARQATAQPKPQLAANDAVTLSPAAKIQQELAETSVQTSREAAQGDNQAKNLQKREAAAKAHGL